MKIPKFLLLILILGTFWRFLNYSNRWVLNQDQSRDAIIGLYSIQNSQLPLIGPPSSAGPFNFGPYYNWLVTFFTLILPFDSGPWIGFTLLSVIVIYIYYLVGKNLLDHQFGLILSLIASFCPALVAISPDMLNTIAVSFAIPLVLYFLVKYLSSYRSFFGFLLGFSVGLAINFHFQSAGLLILFPLILIFNRISFFKRCQILLPPLIGLLLSFLPLLIFDFTHRHQWILSIYNYYTVGVNKFFTPLRWLTEIRDFWPQNWGKIITNIPNLGYLLIPTFLISLYWSLKKGYPLKKFHLILLSSFFFQIILLRYYKGTRSSEYLIFLYPFFIFFTAWSISSFSRLLKPFSYLFILLFLCLTTFQNFKLVYYNPSQTEIIFKIKTKIDQKIGSQSIDYFSLNHPDNQLNNPIFYLFYRQNKQSVTGYKIGVCLPQDTPFLCPDSTKILAQYNHYFLYDLNSFSSHQLTQLGYQHFTPAMYYHQLFTNYSQ